MHLYEIRKVTYSYLLFLDFKAPQYHRIYMKQYFQGHQRVLTKQWDLQKRKYWIYF